MGVSLSGRIIKNRGRRGYARKEKRGQEAEFLTQWDLRNLDKI